MLAGSNGMRRIATALRSGADSSVCRSCQEAFGRRSYSSSTAAATSQNATGAEIPPAQSALKPAYAIKAGVVLSRPPQITRDLTSFEKAYYFYQKRLNERLALPFTKYFYYKRGTPADEDYKRKVKERLTPARDIGRYSAYSKDAWNDELLVGAVESEPEHMVEQIFKDAESVSTSQQEGTAKKEEIPRPAPRVTEADLKNDQRSLNRRLQRTLYLLVKPKDGQWQFPTSLVGPTENLRTAAERTLEQSAGVNMNTWFVGYHPIGHYSHIFETPRKDETGQELAGEKTFFMKSRIMAGQADLTNNQLGLEDFKWLSKDEIQHVVPLDYYLSIRNMLSER